MPFTATAYRVAIASPGDVGEERRIVRQVVHDWNAAHAMSRGAVLLPVGWESDTAPLMGARAQQVINSQIISNADVLIATFWTRLGTPSGAAASGTVEEIEVFLNAGKPVMIYFSSAPVRLDSVDQAQYAALQAFKSWCQQNGLVESYDSVLELRDKLTRQLAMLVNTHPSLSAAAGSGDVTASFPRAEREPETELSEEARLLLEEVAADPSGTLIVAAHLAGLTVQTNGKDFVPEGDARTEALFRDAVEQLVAEGFIRDLGHKGEVFQATSSGFRVGDLLRQRRAAATQ